MQIVSSLMCVPDEGALFRSLGSPRADPPLDYQRPDANIRRGYTKGPEALQRDSGIRTIPPTPMSATAPGLSTKPKATEIP